jgi:EAL domain-containing protein (putative c-di-GMP-specific phosphodiesterase class I)
LWSKVAPDIVKLDCRFANGVASSENQSHAVQYMVTVARKLGGAVVAKGVECADDLCKLRDLGVHFGQGIFLGSPNAEPIQVLNQRARSALLH